MILLIILLLFGLAIGLFVYNIFPRKSQGEILINRLKKKIPKFSGKRKEPITELLKKFINYIERKSKKLNFKIVQEYKESLILPIQKAGNPNRLTPDRLFAIQIASAIGLFLFYIIFLCWGLEVLNFNIVFGLLFLIVGFFFPTLIWLKDLIDKRTNAILRELPNVIDLLTLCVEAGLDFGAAIRKIIEKGRDSPLRDEFIILEKEINMGMSRVEALRNMSKRNDIDELNSFLVALIQAVKMGTSLAPILRSQSEQIRIKRSQRAEKLAAEAPVKMLAPLIICIFPTVFIILFVPIIMQIMGMK